MIALLSAVKARVDHFADYGYGKKYEKNVFTVDPKTKKKKKSTEMVDERTFRSLISMNTRTAFENLDRLQNVVTKSMNAIGKSFERFIEKMDRIYEQKQQKYKNDDNKEVKRPSNSTKPKVIVVKEKSVDSKEVNTN